ncbi:MAG: protealysin inhibitor emfourin [Planctomycetota bacterium]
MPAGPTNPTKIKVKRRGGYAGFSDDPPAIDTARLEPDRARRIEELVKASGFSEFARKPEREGVGSDLVRYEITIREKGREATVAFEDDGSPRFERLRTLADELIGGA